MISERQFLRAHPHFWSRHFPKLDGLYASLRGEGLKSPFMERWAETFSTQVPAQWNDIIAEISFNAFSGAIHQPERQITIRECDIQSAIVKMGLIRGEPLERSRVSDALIDDAVVLADRLKGYFLGRSRVQVHPKLRGFGLLNTLHPDVIAEETIYEVKSSRHFLKREDLKQTLTYFLLSQLNDVRIDKLTIINPRRGTLFSLDTSSLTTLLGCPDRVELKHHFRAAISD